jgi:hypothetical protein
MASECFRDLAIAIGPDISRERCDGPARARRVPVLLPVDRRASFRIHFDSRLGARLTRLRSHRSYSGVVRRPPFSLRLSRAVVGLVTVWCLGCSSYESILTSLLGGRAVGMMACDTETATPSGRRVTDAPPGPLANNPTVSAPAEARGFDCGCGRSCHAPAPPVAVVPQPPALPSAADQLAPTAPAAIARTPLLPPPEFVA